MGWSSFSSGRVALIRVGKARAMKHEPLSLRENSTGGGRIGQSRKLEIGRYKIWSSFLAVFLGLCSVQSMSAQAYQRPSDSRQRPAPAEQKPVPQEEKPVKLSANLITAVASVTNRAGDAVNDLSKEDFEIFEDGVKQEIYGLYRENQMALNLAFLFDTSTSIRTRFDFEKRAASLFFHDVLRPEDKAAVYSVSTEARLEVDFSSDVAAITATLDRMQARGATALYNAVSDAAIYLRKTPGRHVILVLSDGEDTSSTTSLQKALTEVQRSDAVIYCVNSMGVSFAADAKAMAGDTVLKSMSEDTGGLAFFPTVNVDAKKEARELDQIYSRIAADIRGQYLLTYYSKAPTRDGSFRAIKVQVNRPGVSVRSRRGYYASED